MCVHKHKQIMTISKSPRTVRFPENLKWRNKLFEAGITVSSMAEEIGISREALSNTLNGHKKGVNIIPKVEELLSQK